MKNERIDIIEATTAPALRDPISQKNDFLLRTKFTITKKDRIAKRKGTKEISESNQFTAKKLDRETLKITRINGRSKTVLLSLTARSMIILRLKITSAIITTAPVRICLGSIKKSVVRVTKRIGRPRNRANNKNIAMLFR